MAIGDAAAAAGLQVYGSSQDRSLGYQNDNQRGDDIAAVMGRVKVVEAAVNQPIFSARRSTAGQQVGSNAWSVLGVAFASPDVNEGFTSWSAGLLTVALGGLYRVTSHVEFYASTYTTVATQVTVNTATIDTDQTACKDEWSGSGSTAAASATAEGIVRLVPGDVLRCQALQRNSGNAIVTTGLYKADVTFSVEWLRA